MTTKVYAYPQISMLSPIKIMEKEKSIVIGGFTIDGGFYLKEPYSLVKEKVKSISGEKLIYYNIIKTSRKMINHEKALRKLIGEKQ